MGTDVHLIAVAGRHRAAASALDRARERIDELEALWSRFRPTSDISIANAMAGAPVRVSPETIALVQRAIDGYRLTEGRFDPTVLGAVVRAGYDRSYERIRPDARASDARVFGAPSIEVDPIAGLIRLPEGVGFDPGGIGKGLAADIVVTELLDRVDGICVNLGGDLRVAGSAPDDCGWVISIEDPFGGPSHGDICLADGAVATSSRTRRVLRDGGHHLIDPATGSPASTSVASSTVIAGQAWFAEVLAKAAFLAGIEEGPALLRRSDAEGLLVTENGTDIASDDLGLFLLRTVAA
jgi:thiamine biosynthesis lipoprotein